MSDRVELDQSEQNPLTSANGQSRRRLLKATGSAALLLPLVQLTGCAEESPSAAAPAGAADPAAAAQAAAGEAAEAAETAVEEAAETAAEEVTQATEEVAQAAEEVAQSAAPAAGSAEQIEESDPIAKALNYVHDATSVDSAAQPRYAAGQVCANCAQYKATDTDGWGSCAIFPGKLVAQQGWCSGYIPAS